jgi:DNA-binding phage protein
MNTSTQVRPGDLLEQLRAPAKARFGSQTGWAKACGIPKETLSRLKTSSSCDFRTLEALARAAGCTLAAVPAARTAGAHIPDAFDRDYEDRLLELCASGNMAPDAWRASGPGFFMGGLAVLLAGARGFERGRYLALAEALHPGISTPEVFALWLKRSPVQAARFLPMARRRKGLP